MCSDTCKCSAGQEACSSVQKQRAVAICCASTAVEALARAAAIIPDADESCADQGRCSRSWRESAAECKTAGLRKGRAGIAAAIALTCAAAVQAETYAAEVTKGQRQRAGLEARQKLVQALLRKHSCRTADQLLEQAERAKHGLDAWWASEGASSCHLGSALDLGHLSGAVQGHRKMLCKHSCRAAGGWSSVERPSTS